MKPLFANISFPFDGVDRRSGYQDQPPKTTPLARNVRPEGALQSRVRGGSRPGLAKAIAHDYDATINVIVPISVVSGGARASKLVVAAGGTVSVIGGVTTTTPTSSLLTESGVELLTEDGETLLCGSGGSGSGGSLAACQMTGRAMKIYAAESTLKTYDPETGVIDAVVATKGSVPVSCPLVCVYRDRIVLSGADHCLWMSRQGNPADWDLGADVQDEGRAFVFQLSGAGQVGETVTAVIPHEDALMYAATRNELWLLQGDPTTGRFGNVHRRVGIIGGSAWCKTPDGMLVFLGVDGVYLCPVGGSPERLSLEKVPEELQDIDTSTNAVTMIYDHKGGGVWLFVTPITGTGSHWWIDLRNKSMWPMSFQDGHQPTTACYYGDDLILGCVDGYLRKFDAESDDDGSDLVSHVFIGPIWMAGDGVTDVILTELQSAVSGAVTWRLIAGESAESVVDMATDALECFDDGDLSGVADIVREQGAWGDGRNRPVHPRVRAPWIIVWMQGSSAWSYESVSLGYKRLRRWR